MLDRSFIPEENATFEAMIAEMTEKPTKDVFVPLVNVADFHRYCYYGHNIKVVGAEHHNDMQRIKMLPSSAYINKPKIVG